MGVAVEVGVVVGASVELEVGAAIASKLVETWDCWGQRLVAMFPGWLLWAGVTADQQRAPWSGLACSLLRLGQGWTGCGGHQ